MGNVEYTDQNGDSVKEFFTFDPVREEENKTNAKRAELVFNIKFIPFYPILLGKGLSFNAILLYGWIEFFTGGERAFQVTDQQVANLFKYSVATAERAMKELKNKGLVTLTHKITKGKGLERLVRIKNEGPSPLTHEGTPPLTSEGPTIVYKISNTYRTGAPLKNEETGGARTPQKEKGDGTKKKYRDFVFLSDSELEQLVSRFGERDAQARIERLDDYIGSRGVKYASHYRTILVWAKKDAQTSVTLPSPQSLESKRKENEERIAKMREAGLFDREARFKKIREDAALENLKQQEI